MWKNKEVRYGTLIGIVMFILQGALLVSMQVILWKKVILCIISISLFSLFLGSSYYRSRKIRSYTNYLCRIQNGEYTIPLEENEESELSILQNEIYKVTRRLLEQADLLQEKTIFLSDSLSNISHQLKTPVTSLLMMADLLQRPDLPEDKRLLFTENIQAGLERMRWLVQGLLTLAKLDSGSIVMKKQMVCMQELIKESLRQLHVLADEKQITIEVDGDSYAMYSGDFSWSVEAVTNIVKNALEHTKEGGTIRISYGINRLYAEIKIQDTGEGIDNEDLHHVFERFYKGKNASSHSVGIGLALAKEIIVRQRGTISIASEKGKGTEFHLKFYEEM